MALPGRVLKVGLLLDSLEIPAWARSAIEGFEAAQVRLGLLLVTVGSAAPAVSPRRVRSLYTALDEHLNRVAPDALEPATLRDQVREVPVLESAVSREGDADRLAASAAAAVRERSIDVLVDFRGRPLVGEILDAPPLGTWSWRHGGQPIGGVAGYWEVARRLPITEVSLVVAGERGTTRAILGTAHLATDPSSVRRNRNAAYWKAAALLRRALESIARAGPQQLAARLAAGGESPDPERRAAPAPTTWSSTHLLARVLLRRAYHEVRSRVLVERWTIVYSLQPGRSLAPWRFRALRPPPDRAWADPHLWRRGRDLHLFLEEVSYPSRKGHLAVSTLDAANGWSTPVKVLDAPYHLSNPFVFEHDGALYLIPESAAHRSIDLYRCERFPDGWTHVKALMTGVRAVDTTLLRHGGRWWMFVNIADGPGASTYDELHLFHAPDPVSGAWTPHPCNPVVSDVRCARPAGPVFVRDGALVRPAQDCSRRYGYAVRFMRIDRLDEGGYAETEIGAIVPPAHGRYLGIHTFDQQGAVTVADALRTRWRFREPIEPRARTPAHR